MSDRVPEGGRQQYQREFRGPAIPEEIQTNFRGFIDKVAENYPTGATRINEWKYDPERLLQVTKSNEHKQIVREYFVISPTNPRSFEVGVRAGFKESENGVVSPDFLYMAGESHDQRIFMIFSKKANASVSMGWHGTNIEFSYSRNGDMFSVSPGDVETVDEEHTIPKEYDPHNVDFPIMVQTEDGGDMVVEMSDEKDALVLTKWNNDPNAVTQYQSSMKVPLHIDEAEIKAELFPGNSFKDPYNADPAGDASWKRADLRKLIGIEEFDSKDIPEQFKRFRPPTNS